MTLNHMNVSIYIYWEKRIFNTRLLFSNHRLRSFNKSRSDHVRSEFMKIQTVNNGNQCANYYHELNKGNTRSSPQKTISVCSFLWLVSWNETIMFRILSFSFSLFARYHHNLLNIFVSQLVWIAMPIMAMTYDLHDRHPYSVQSTFVKSRLSNKK